MKYIAEQFEFPFEYKHDKHEEKLTQTIDLAKTQVLTVCFKESLEGARYDIKKENIDC